MYDSMAIDHCERYNQLHSIGHQKKTLERCDFLDILWSVAQVLHRHGAHAKFGISLLHRHQELAPGCAMVHSRDLPGEDICTMEPRGKRQIFPYAYHFDCGEFVPYEYSSTQTPTPEKPLLAELATLLESRDICQLIGIFHVKSPGAPWREQMLCSGTEGTIAKQLSTGEGLSPGDIVTEWVVREGILGVELQAHKGCTDTEAGHKRTQD